MGVSFEEASDFVYALGSDIYTAVEAAYGSTVDTTEFESWFWFYSSDEAEYAGVLDIVLDAEDAETALEYISYYALTLDDFVYLLNAEEYSYEFFNETLHYKFNVTELEFLEALSELDQVEYTTEYLLYSFEYWTDEEVYYYNAFDAIWWAGSIDEAALALEEYSITTAE
jgi:hypothetical protein